MTDSLPAYQTDSAGHYVGTVRAWASPLEPGVYHLPRGAVWTPPPEPAAGQWPRWNGAAWELIPLPQLQGSAATASQLSPVEKLADFLAANPDVAALINPPATTDPTH